MLFPTLTFIQFFFVVYPLNWLLRSRDRLWKPFILVASYAFYGYWDWRFVGLLVLKVIGAVRRIQALTSIQSLPWPQRRPWTRAASPPARLNGYGDRIGPNGAFAIVPDICLMIA